MLDKPQPEDYPEIPSYSGEIKLVLPDGGVIGYTTIVINDEKKYLAVLVDDSIHYSGIRGQILKEVIRQNEQNIRDGKVSRKILEAEGFSHLWTALHLLQAKIWTFGQFKNKFMHINRAMCIKLMVAILDIVILHDIQEDEAQSEEPPLG